MTITVYLGFSSHTYTTSNHKYYIVAQFLLSAYIYTWMLQTDAHASMHKAHASMQTYLFLMGDPALENGGTGLKSSSSELKLQDVIRASNQARYYTN